MTRVAPVSDSTASPPAIGPVLQRLTLPVFAPVFLIQIGSAMLIPVLPLALRANALSYTGVTLVLAANGLGSLVSQIPVGRLLTRRSENEIMMASMVILAVTIGSLGLTAFVLALMGLRFISGIGATGWLLSRQTYMTRTVRTSVRGRAMALFGGLNRLAYLIGPLLGGLVADQVGFREAFLLSAGITGVGLIPLAIARRRESAPTVDTYQVVQRRSEPPNNPLEVFRSHRHVLVTAGSAQSCITAVRYGRFVILPLIAELIGLGVAEVGLLITIGSAADMILFPASGYLMDRYGRLAAIVPSFTLLGTGLLVLAAAQSYPMMVTAASIIGVGNGLGAGTMLTLSSDLAPQDSPGEFLAALGTIRELGRIVGPLGVGLFADQLGLGSAAVALSLVSFLGVAIMVLFVGETKNRPLQGAVEDRFRP